MAVATVMLRESLRPWFNAGLEFVLDEHGLFAAARAQAAAGQGPVLPATSPVASPAPYPGAHAGQQTGSQPGSPGSQEKPQPVAARGAQPKGASNVTPTGQAGAQAGARRQPPSSVRPPAQDGPAIHPTAVPPEEWPAQWQQIWGKVRVPSPVVWTYWSLGEDLCGTANPERGALLRRIIGALQLPAGSSVFWPVALPERSSGTPDTPNTPGTPNTQGAAEASGAAGTGTPAGVTPVREGTLAATPELIAAPEIFLAGLRRIRPRYCITFGSRALKSFAPATGLAPYTFTQFLGHRLLALPDIDILLKNPAPLPAVTAFLREAVKLRA
ncbi:hypothetical protein [Desulfovibrio psychrotolerans]|uniref:Uracil-DNA glycosylase n=1 Tax=Desulfovibrio psychrotolerans TaxID=415242 RepID=A0A7J0BXZ2_9BACT|nr:hypothetical protein [Desulfovibrio psychrotolerans]GFM38560.1 hypothetical protein DSM19430T_32440 [Desulfovibrio psychrotolerans]